MSQAETQLRTQWHSPSDILSLLLILGPEVIQRALAQLAGSGYVPVGFSFGWVAYSVNSLVAIAGDGGLMPAADSQALVVNASFGHQRNNQAWIIGRLLRDYEKRAEPFSPNKSSPEWEALRISIFKWDEHKEQGRPTRDWLWYSGIVIIVLQLSISIIPWVLMSEWATTVLVAGGIGLAQAQAALPQWKAEKWACPRNGGTVSITKGNGHRHVMVLLGSPKALDLEILAAGSKGGDLPVLMKVAVAGLAASWTILLITVAGLKQGSWYLLATGTIGMIQNIVVSSSPRSPNAFGIHISHIQTIKASKVSKALMKAEQYCSGVGTSLIPVFNPGGFRAPPDEIDFWQKITSEKQHLDVKTHNGKGNPLEHRSETSTALAQPERR
ncbi:hypothetical protein G7Y79_00014g037280 [Physcia stellaris]|nr:hypothetical protein G7Y79_00014g037280 [Physcia stellaris]